MSFDAAVPLDCHEGFRYEQAMVPTPMVPPSEPLTGFGDFDCGLSFANEFNPVFLASQDLRQNVVVYTDDWSVEFRRLQRAYVRSRLAMPTQGQEARRVHFEDQQATAAALPLWSPPIADGICPRVLSSGTPVVPQLSRSDSSLTSCPNGSDQDVGEVEPSIAHPKGGKIGSFVSEPPERTSGTETPKDIEKHVADDVPLYSPGACDTASVISGLESMENELRAETARRISQVEKSRIK
ncbi:hypothetical protein F5Y07DRAFT_395612 [Xylaria sp. FL0933]|nr:hypothetical protein F5Y07DRAFT_395612 [Xylaria sp. FL0933]